MASTESRHASKPSVSALEAARARMRKDDQLHEPRTPPPAHHRNRSMVSSFGSSSSPLSSSFRNEEDAVILELGSRYLRAGFEGESMPMCTVEFGPEQSRKAGDYRGWMKPRESAGGAAVFLDADEWTRNHELWQMDLREVDLGLVCDKLERAVREIYNNYLLTDAGTARLVLVIPSIMPHPLLTVVLETLFDRWRFPSITLMPSAAMVAAAAGVRAALVVDIGWAETTVTAVYEYRDIASKSSSRATKALVQGMGNMLSHLNDGNEEKPNKISVDFNYCEEVVSRLAWCKIEAEDEYRDRDVSIPSPSHNASNFVQVPFSHFAKPVEEVFFAQGTDERELDDEEKPIHVLVYNVLLQLPPDLRGPCMSRMIFVGGGSRIPGIRQRVLNEVSALVSKYGWDATRGRAVEEQRKRIQQLELTRKHVNVLEVSGAETTTEPDLQSTEAEAEAEEKQGDKEPEEIEEDIDFIEQKIRRNQSRNSKPFIQGQFRQVESLGAWAGASLVSSLKIRGLVEIDREKFLRDGLAGASRDVDGLYQAAERRAGMRSSVVSDRSSWTLAGWG